MESVHEGTMGVNDCSNFLSAKSNDIDNSTANSSQTSHSSTSPQQKSALAKSQKSRKAKRSLNTTSSSIAVKCCKVDDSMTDTSSENVDYLIFTKLEDVDNYIMEQEMNQTTKFILSRNSKGFGIPDPDIFSQTKQRVKWIASGVKFMGKPFLLIGEKNFDCRHGKDKNWAKKIRYNEKRKCLVSCGEQLRINSVRKSEQLKTDCPAKIKIRDILVYSEFGIGGAVDGDHDLPSLQDPTKSDGYVKHNAQRRLRDRTSARIRSLLEGGKKLKTERQFHLSFPRIEAHQGHEVGQAAGTNQPVDRRLISHMHKLVSEGVIHVENMKPRLDDYVVHIFAGKPLPDKDNRRYYPLSRDLSNHIQKAMASLMSSTQSTENLQQLYENLQRENPSDSLLFRPSVEGSSKLFYFHQTQDQQWLLKVNPKATCSIEVRYRAKKSSLPMFFVKLQAGTSPQTVCTFILEDNSDLTEVISKLLQLNPTWSPSEWLVEHDKSHLLLNILQAAFPQSTIVVREAGKKTVRSRGKRNRNQTTVTSSEPKDLGVTLRDTLREFNRLSYVVPSNDHTWSLVNNLQSILNGLRNSVEGSSVTATALNELSTSIPQQQPLETTSSSHNVSDNLRTEQQLLTVTNGAPSPSKHICNDVNMLPLCSTELNTVVPTVGQITGTADQHQVSTNKYNHQPIASNLVPHHSQSGMMSQQVMQTSAIQQTAAPTHTLIHMGNPGTIPLQVTNILSSADNYQLHNHTNTSSYISSMYGQVSQQQQRHYLELHRHDDQSFLQQVAKLTNE